MRKYIGELGLVITAIIWGSGFSGSAIALEHYTAYQILAGRFLIGAILLCLVFPKRLKRLSKQTILKGVLIGIFLYGAFLLQTVGLQFTTPSKNAFLTAVNVVIVPFIAFVLYKKRPDNFELAGAVLAIIGVGILSLEWSAGINFGDLLTLGCAVGFAFHIFYTAKYVKNEDPIVLTMIQMATAAILGLIVAAFKGEMNVTYEPEGMRALIYLGVFSTTIAFLIQTAAQKFTTETKAAIILSTESFWGMVFSVIIIHEMLTFKMIIGAILILCAIMLSETKPSIIRRKRMKKTA